MPIRAAVTLAATVVAVVLLISFRTPPAAPITLASPPGSSSTPSPAPAATASPDPPAARGTPARTAAPVHTPAPTPAPTRTPRPTPAPTAGTTGIRNGTFTGPAVYIYYGNIQLRLGIAGGRIVAVKALQYPNDNPQSSYINSVALPMLRQQVLKVQSAQINGVSGATYTSYGFYHSLVSALKAAHA